MLLLHEFLFETYKTPEHPLPVGPVDFRPAPNRIKIISWLKSFQKGVVEFLIDKFGREPVVEVFDTATDELKHTRTCLIVGNIKPKKTDQTIYSYEIKTYVNSLFERSPSGHPVVASSKVVTIVEIWDSKGNKERKELKGNFPNVDFVVAGEKYGKKIVFVLKDLIFLLNLANGFSERYGNQE
jgi:hypothetical protein